MKINSVIGGLGLALILAGSTALASTLVGYGVLPADTFEWGPASGAFNGDGLRGQAQFAGQPVQGFSGIHNNGDGTYWMLSDNGFGNKKNSADYNLRLHRVRPDFKTASGGTGSIDVEGFLQLSDPDRKVNFLIVNENTVDRTLTGADFDIESFVFAADGTLWFGDEFGPFLLHTNAQGKVLEAPIWLPDFAASGKSGSGFVVSPDDPFIAGPVPGQISPANLNRSKGFEGMAYSPDRTVLYPLLEGPVSGDPADCLRIHAFDTKTRSYTGKFWRYRLSDPGNAIGDMAPVNGHEFLIIERDNGQGPTAKFKKIFKVDLNAVDSKGYIYKEEVVDLMNIKDPGNLAGLGPIFTFPFVTIEDIVVLDPTTIIVCNDNNYPATGGRGAGVKDPNEFLMIRLERPL